jgi:hypothetical protein
MIRMRALLISTALAAVAVPSAAAQASTPPEPPAPASTSHATTADTATRINPVAAARDATARYRGFRHAKQAGYGLFHDAAGIACISMPGMGAMGIHFVNGSLVGDGKVQLKRPEAVVYDREHGHRHLVALEYVVLKKDWERVHGANAHRPRLYGHRFNLTHAGNRYGLPAFYSLHAWIWKHNPAGMFAMWNPDVHCS